MDVARAPTDGALLAIARTMREADLMSEVQVQLTEFSELIEQYTARFVGREWLVQQVDTLLEDPGCRFVVITGDAGVGKTAFMAHLAKNHPGWPRYFIRRDSRELLRPGDANTFLLTAGGQLATIHPELFRPENLEVVVRQRIDDLTTGGEAIGVRIQELQASPFYSVSVHAEQEIRRVAGKAKAVEIGRLVAEPRLLSMQDLQYMGLLYPARFLHQTHPQARIVILIDALDELRYSPADPDILRALCELPEIPPNLRFVVSSRRETFLDRLLSRGDVRELGLDMATTENWEDLRTYAKANLPDGRLEPALTQEKRTREGFIQDLLVKAAGNFLYLRSVLGAISEALTAPGKEHRLRNLVREEGLPDDLDALYDYFLASIVDWMTRSGFGEATWRSYLRPLLGALAATFEPLSEGQLSAFTGLNAEDIGDLLRELTQFVEPVEGQRAYSIYHSSFAEYLLDAESNVTYRIDGSKVHRRIAGYYLDAWGGLEARLPGLLDPETRKLHSGYGLRHLAAHLALAGRVEALRQLLQLEQQVDGHRENVWFVVRAADDPREYLSDVDSAWRISEKADGVGMQIRCALYRSSVASLSANWSGKLLAWAAEHTLLRPEQAIVMAQEMPEEWERVEALVQLAPYLPEKLLEETLTAAREVWTVYDEARPPKPWDSKPLQMGYTPWKRFEAADAAAAPKIVNGWRLSRALALLCPYLPEALHKEALATAQMIKDTPCRILALIDLAPQLPELLREEALLEALHATQDVESGDWQGWDRWYGGRRAERWWLRPGKLPGEALSAAWEIATRWEGSRATILAKVASHLQEPLRQQTISEALTYARELENVASRIHGLVAVAELMPEPMRQQVLQEALDAREQMSEAVFIPGEFEDVRERAHALIALAPYLSGPLREAVLKEELKQARKIWDAGVRSSVIVDLAPCLSEELLRKALAMARKIRDADGKASVLGALAPYLPEPLREQANREAWTAARQISNARRRAEALVDLAAGLETPSRHVLAREVMASTREIGDIDQRTRTLIAMNPSRRVPGLGRKWQSFVARLGQRKRFVTYSESSMDCTGLWGALPEFVAVITSWMCRWLVAALAPHVPQSLREPVLGRALTTAAKIPELGSRARALTSLAPYLPERLLEDLVTAIQEIRWPKARVAALTGVASNLSATLRERVMNEALTTAREIRSPMPRPGGRTLGESIGRVEALVNVALHLPESMLEQVLGEALEAVREIPSEGGYVDALGDLAPLLSDRLLGRAVELVQELDSESLQAEALHRLAPHLTQKSIRQALAVARNIDDAGNRDHALSGLSSRLARFPASECSHVWLDVWDGTNLLRSLARRPRFHLLSDLVALQPVIRAMGGRQAREETRLAIEDVGHWWP